MKYKVGCTLSYEVETETTFIFNLQVAKTRAQQILTESLVLTPELVRSEHEDLGSHNRYCGINVPVGSVGLEYNAEVDLVALHADPATINETPIGKLPLNILPFLLPSRFVPSDLLAPFAEAEFGKQQKGHQRVNGICNWINEHLAYERGSSDEHTAADQSLLKRAGVCRDFAHLGIAFCRGLGIPARFVSCYAYGLMPSDFHAVFEAFLDGRWWLFDATRQAHLDGLFRIGIGRDAAEMAFSTPYGDFTPTEMNIRIARSDGQADLGPRTVDAISVDPHEGAWP
jgi:transglutaminase-like putative cysteine protease